MKRGYSISMDSNNKVIKSIKDIKKKDAISISVSDGVIKANVIDLVKENRDG